MRTISLAVLGVLVAGAIAWGVAGRVGSSDPQMASTGHAPVMDTNPPYDRVFIDGMVPHHQLAVQMAQIVLERGKRPELRGMAKSVIDAQSKEITQMKAWRKAWFGSADTPMEMAHATPGMDLSALTGAADVDRAFIDQMVLHHQNAIDIATQAKTNAQHLEIRDLAARITTAQQSEVAQMERWRTAWYG